ncbi:hypothetical protein ACH4U6_14875 [Streptomyces netropsis]|uniref:hypothetical protein n=1 Tax=Streptomyces netropsis TaxID=55404 RepID=UPI003789DF01
MRFLRAVCLAVTALVLASCAGPPAEPRRPGIPASEQARDDLIKSAQRALVTRCLAERGLTLRAARTTRARDAGVHDRRLQDALFGTGRRELSLTLATGYTVTAHTDGCQAAAQRVLYGDQRRWFRAQVTVDNLRAEAGARMATDPRFRAALARWNRCATPPGAARPEHPAPAVVTRCDRESGLADVRARLEPARLAEVRALRRDQLTTYAQLRTRALHRAVELATAQPNSHTDAHPRTHTEGHDHS